MRLELEMMFTLLSPSDFQLVHEMECAPGMRQTAAASISLLLAENRDIIAEPPGISRGRWREMLNLEDLLLRLKKKTLNLASCRFQKICDSELTRYWEESAIYKKGCFWRLANSIRRAAVNSSARSMVRLERNNLAQDVIDEILNDMVENTV